MTENDGLSNRNDAIDIAQGLIFLLEILAFDVILLDVFKTFLLLEQTDNRWIRYNNLSEFHHVFVVSR